MGRGQPRPGPSGCPLCKVLLDGTGVACPLTPAGWGGSLGAERKCLSRRILGDFSLCLSPCFQEVCVLARAAGGRGEAESRKLEETRAEFRHRHTRTRTHTHSRGQTHSYTQEHTLRQVITDTQTQITGAQSHAWTQTRPQTYPGSGARLSVRPAQVGHRLHRQGTAHAGPG